ncbi:MAG: hypothetical protein GWN30_00670 [Gammaproteobacteria bacterium]|nr:hypothetical protein [Gammaproteobacteria bacterium]NIW98620.1 hypothetical protein [Phycisphaerae bacterium]
MDRAYKTFTIEIPLDEGQPDDDKCYLGLFGVIDLFNQIKMTREEKQRVLDSLCKFNGD